ncbi:MAG: hypothetical protein Q4F60_01930, partial [Candidatus Saccharibacteria bacterium]|nr:hypothetical protein [Candidatus Saccharibacteria bacterium]
MKYFDRINIFTSRLQSRHSNRPSRFCAMINPLAILFVFILGLSRPHLILDYSSFTLETKTFVNRELSKISVNRPKSPVISLAVSVSNSTAKSATSATKATIKTTEKPTTNNSTLKNSISFSGRTIEIFYSSDTKIDSGSRVGFYGSGFLYGHNSSAVFGSLGSVQNFSVTLNGVTKNYQVVNRVTLPKTCANSTECAQKYMKPFTSTRSYRGKTYDLILMTCAGTPTGPGDA